MQNAERGWGTTLKPSHEPIVVARKPFSDAAVENVLTLGTGGLNIDKCRVFSEKPKRIRKEKKVIRLKDIPQGRFPANVIHGGLDGPWSPYFYCVKPTVAERDHGLESFDLKSGAKNPTGHKGATGTAKNIHPTVKPIVLMEYLITLVTPEGGTVLDPFAGSGSTLIAAQNLDHPFIGIEQDVEYVKIAEARLAA